MPTIKIWGDAAEPVVFDNYKDAFDYCKVNTDVNVIEHFNDLGRLDDFVFRGVTYPAVISSLRTQRFTNGDLDMLVNCDGDAVINPRGVRVSPESNIKRLRKDKEEKEKGDK
jgi:hypothetical protein